MERLIFGLTRNLKPIMKSKLNSSSLASTFILAVLLLAACQSPKRPVPNPLTEHLIVVNDTATVLLYTQLTKVLNTGRQLPEELYHETRYVFAKTNADLNGKTFDVSNSQEVHVQHFYRTRQGMLKSMGPLKGTIKVLKWSENYVKLDVDIATVQSDSASHSSKGTLGFYKKPERH